MQSATKKQITHLSPDVGDQVEITQNKRYGYVSFYPIDGGRVGTVLGKIVPGTEQHINLTVESSGWYPFPADQVVYNVEVDDTEVLFAVSELRVVTKSQTIEEVACPNQ
jgi:hypothetical protein